MIFQHKGFTKGPSDDAYGKTDAYNSRVALAWSLRETLAGFESGRPKDWMEGSHLLYGPKKIVARSRL